MCCIMVLRANSAKLRGFIIYMYGPDNACCNVQGGKGAGTKAGNGAGVLEGVDDAGLQTGCLRVVIPLHALPEHRDWLRNGKQHIRVLSFRL